MFLRPQPFRGDQVAAGVVVLATVVVLVNARFVDEWEPAVHLVYTGLAAIAVTAMGALSEREPGGVRAYQSILFLTGFALLFVALVRLADLLGAEDPPTASETIVWTGTVLTAYALWFAARGAAACTLVGAASGVITIVATVDLLADFDELRDLRVTVLLCVVGLGLLAVVHRDRRPRHAIALVDVAGLSVLFIGLTFVLELLFSGLLGSITGARADVSVGAGWELLFVATGFGLIAFGAVERAPVPGAIGLLNLVAFVIVAGAEDASLLWWPLLLALGGGALLVVGLRPSHPLPPAPLADSEPPPPLPLKRV